MKTAKLILIISPFWLLLCLESWLIWPQLLWGSELLAIIWLILAIRYLARRSSLGKHWFVQALMPALLFLVLSFSAAILVNRWLVQAVFIFLIFFLTRYLQVLYKFWVDNDLKQLDRLPNFSLSAGLLTVFFGAFDVYSLQAFVSWSSWSFFFLALAILAAVVYHNWQVCRLNWRDNWPLFLAIVVILAETLAVLFFWPFNYQVIALSAVLVYYVLINSARLYLGAKEERRKIKFYLLFSALVFVILILTARWF